MITAFDLVRRNIIALRQLSALLCPAGEKGFPREKTLDCPHFPPFRGTSNHAVEYDVARKHESPFLTYSSWAVTHIVNGLHGYSGECASSLLTRAFPRRKDVLAILGALGLDSVSRKSGVRRLSSTMPTSQKRYSMAYGLAGQVLIPKALPRKKPPARIACGGFPNIGGGRANRHLPHHWVFPFTGAIH